MDSSVKVILTPIATMVAGPFGFPVSMLIGVMGIGVSLTDMPPSMQVIFAVLGVLVLVLTVLVKLETFIDKRSERIVEDKADKLMAQLAKEASENPHVSQDVIDHVAEQIE